MDLPGARVAFSTRQGGVSEGPYESLNLGILTDDEPDRVEENRRRLAGHVQLDPARIAMGWQVHGTDIASWPGPPPAGRNGFAAPGAQLDKVDGHTTTVSALGLLVLVADCLPVALAGAGRVAMLHCGWRGLAGGMIEKGIALFAEPPAAAVGPGIGRCCYEVGPEVLDAFADLAGVTDGRMLDLRGVAEARLRRAGVTRVEHTDLCTSCHPDLLFSHRRDRGVTGRQAGVVWLTR
ncbi:MAG: laccase domain-containing protein [Thermoleophilaceae bacterium]|nr:laccase domain-containing protein [Thermoleophilaceae bacterium]